jgi:uncharacterized cupredoxin-like copper-binding protein
METFMKKLATASLLALAFSSLALAQEVPPSHAEIVKTADWNKMETITVELTEHEFSPHNLSLKANQPYRMVIRNNGEKDHYYTAAEFFKSVAWRKAQTPRPHGGEMKAPYFTAVEAYKKGGSIELFFVPVKKGTFEVICTIEDHKDLGMTGAITVE